MAQTVIDIRTVRRGTRWVSVLTIDAPNLKAPIDFCSESDLRQELGAMRTFLGLGTETASAASAQSRRKVVERVATQALLFVDKHPSYLGASVGWAKDALFALAKSSDMLRQARGGDPSSMAKVSEIYQKAKSDPDAKRSARLLEESASLLDHGRATLRVKVAGGTSTGHDIGTRRDLQMLPAHVGGLQEMSSLRHHVPTRAVDPYDDDHELVLVDPFKAMPYHTGGASLDNLR